MADKSVSDDLFHSQHASEELGELIEVSGHIKWFDVAKGCVHRAGPAGSDRYSPARNFIAPRRISDGAGRCAHRLRKSAMATAACNASALLSHGCLNRHSPRADAAAVHACYRHAIERAGARDRQVVQPHQGFRLPDAR